MTDVPFDPDLRVPHAALEGNVWLALPLPHAQTVLALLYLMEQTQWWRPDDLRRHKFA